MRTLKPMSGHWNFNVLFLGHYPAKFGMSRPSESGDKYTPN